MAAFFDRLAVPRHRYNINRRRTGHGMGCRFSIPSHVQFFRCFIFIAAFVLAAFKAITPTVRPSKAVEHIDPCTFDELYSAFVPLDLSEGGGEDCWSLKHEILRIPQEAIVNRGNMEKLGEGSKGRVYKAAVKLSTEKVCSIAIKTAKQRNRALSLVGTEYLGALPFYAARKGQLSFPPGLIPTWGLVHDSEELLPIKQDSMRYSLDTVPVMCGVVMPLVKFETVKSIFDTETRVNLTGDQIAHVMLPAAEALSFIERLGFQTRDVHTKNIGVKTDFASTVIFDYNFMSRINGSICSFKVKNMCNFCPEKRFDEIPLRRKKRSCPNDCSCFIKVALEMLEHWTGQSNDSQVLEGVLRNYSNSSCRMEDVHSTLISFIE